MREFSVLIQPAPELQGQWIAHCLNWDLITQGDSPAHVTEMIVEAIVLAIEEDTSEGLNPDDRPSAPDDCWDLFRKTQHEGFRIVSADVDSLKSSSDVVIAAVLYLQQIPAQPTATEIDALLASAPPAFMIADLRGGGHSVRG